MYAGAMGATVMLVMVAVQSIRAVRSLPDSQRLRWAWSASFTGCIVYGMVVSVALF